MSRSFLLSFDLPKEMAVIRARIHRKLKKINAKMIHESLWESSSLQALIDIAELIAANGGSAKY